MGLVYADIKLENTGLPKLKPVKARALVDTGAIHMCISPEIALQLKLKTSERRGVVLADGSVRKLPYVGPIKVSFENRYAFVGALVAGDEVLLGAIPMEDMDLVISPLKRTPLKRTITVNPAHPNIPVVSLKVVQKIKAKVA